MLHENVEMRAFRSVELEQQLLRSEKELVVVVVVAAISVFSKSTSLRIFDPF